MISVLLAGGFSKRLYPLGNNMPPKQFHALLGGEYSLLQRTARLASALGPVVTVTSSHYSELAHRQLAEMGAAEHILLEPMGRNTAIVAALAVAYIALTWGQNAPICLLPCDHWVADETRFQEQLRTAVTVDSITLLGAAPESPSPDYGYILPEPRGTFVARFVEKPPAEIAAQLITQGALWNAGVFIATAQTFLDAFAAHAPEIWAGGDRALASATPTPQGMALDASIYAGIPAHPIDKAVIEPCKNLRVLPLATGWSDIGTWERLNETRARMGLGPMMPAAQTA